MASYFVARPAPAAAEAPVHDRTLCPPDCFLAAPAMEYLGDFLHPGQAVAVARLRYANARACPACEPVRHRTPLLPALALPTAPA